MTIQKAVERFIPYRSTEIIDMLCAGWGRNVEAQQQFRAFCTILESLYHFEFHDKVKALKDYYHPFDPDKDTNSNRVYTPENLHEYETKLIAKFTEVINNANYETLTEQDIQHALNESSLFSVSLHIDFDDFANYIIYRRGDIVRKTTIKKWYFWQVEVNVPTFERVVMLVKFKDAQYFATKSRTHLPFEPGSMVIKLFKDIPKADLEMLFPNAQVKMNTNEKLMMGVPAIGGAIGIIMKTGAGLLAFIIVLQALISHFLYGGGFTMPSPSELAQIIGGVTALGAIGGFLFQQWAKYKNRKIEFLKILGDNLYFKNLDNNVGVFHHIVDAAEEEECKEAILGYYFLLKHPPGLTAAELDQSVEAWFATKYGVNIDFEVDDAVRKLQELNLCKLVNGAVYQVLDLTAACRHLDEIWDNYFQYNV